MIPFYEYVINENDETGFSINSMVDAPAHMKAFLTFAKNDIKYFANDEEMTVMGVLISAGTPIFRRDNELGEYYGVFKKETITKIKNKLMREIKMHGVNKNHNGSDIAKGAYMTDIFQIDSKKGITTPTTLSNQNLQDGTLIAIYKITDQKTWSEIKQGKFQGFSIEAILDVKQVNLKQANKMSKTSKKGTSLFERIFGSEGEHTFAEVTTVDGLVLSYEGELAEGTAVFVQDENGDNLPAPAGDYQVTLEDESVVILTVDDMGVITAIAPVEGEEDTTTEEVLSQVAEVMKKTLLAQSARFEAIEKENKALRSELEAIKNAKPSKFENEPKKSEVKKTYKDLLK